MEKQVLLPDQVYDIKVSDAFTLYQSKIFTETMPKKIILAAEYALYMVMNKASSLPEGILRLEAQSLDLLTLFFRAVPLIQVINEDKEWEGCYGSLIINSHSEEHLGLLLERNQTIRNFSILPIIQPYFMSMDPR